MHNAVLERITALCFTIDTNINDKHAQIEQLCQENERAQKQTQFLRQGIFRAILKNRFHLTVETW